MPDAVSLGISSCPNDTFVFDAWVNGKLGPDVPQVCCRIEDISTLNGMALNGELDVVKVSFFAYGAMRDTYSLLNAGGALGRGCGPLIVARDGHMTRSDLAAPDVRVALPGRWTTANLLASLYQPRLRNRTFMRFEQIMPAVAGGSADAGVVIHEGRFTFERYGLVMVEDLGAWWEMQTGCPLPLGAVVARKSLGHERALSVESAIRDSLGAALADPHAPMEFMRRHAGEMDDEVMRRHVELYVNEYSLDYGENGRKAIDCLLNHAEKKNLFRL